MDRTEFLTKTVASYRQVDYWIRKGIPIGENNNKGPGSRRIYSDLDAKICDVLASLSFFMGRYVPTHKSVTGRDDVPRKVAEALRENPQFLENNRLLITIDGRVYTTGYVLSPGWIVPTKPPSYISGNSRGEELEKTK